MKLQTLDTVPVVLDLPNDLLWVDENTWVPVVSTEEWGVTGALIIHVGTKQAGRPITLTPQSDMAWVPRSTVLQLIAWASAPGVQYKLVLEYPTDTREFTVVFKTSENPVDATPVAGFPAHGSTDWYNVKLKFLTV